MSYKISVVKKIFSFEPLQWSQVEIMFPEGDLFCWIHMIQGNESNHSAVQSPSNECYPFSHYKLPQRNSPKTTEQLWWINVGDNVKMFSLLRHFSNPFIFHTEWHHYIFTFIKECYSLSVCCNPCGLGGRKKERSSTAILLQVSTTEKMYLLSWFQLGYS